MKHFYLYKFKSFKKYINMSNLVINQLIEDGVVVIKNAYAKEQINNLKNFSKDIENKGNELLLEKTINQKTKPQIYNYTTHYDKEICHKKKFYENDNIHIIEIVKGRYDMSLKNCDKDIHTSIEEVVNHLIKPENRSYTWGLLTSSANSVDGHWHRDTVNINGDAEENGDYDDSVMVHHMKPFYFTVLIPLVPLNKENGTPEFIRGSHKLTYKESINKEHIRMNTDLGDIIIFDGRIFHRGCKNISKKERPVLYNMIHRNWYIENGK